MALSRKQRKIIEDLGWDIEIEEYHNGEKRYLISQYSPLGEDFSFSVSYDDPVNDIIIYYNDYDAEEHAEMFIEFRGRNGVPSSIRALLKDADDIEEMLEKLAEALRPH